MPNRLREATLRAFWASRFSIREYKAEEGESVSVKFPGFESEGAGPDFQGAIVFIGGTERRGEVEIHRRKGDWRAHGHHHDPRYEGAVLHVVLHPEGPGAETLSGRKVLTVSLAGNLGGLLEEFVKRAKEEAERPCPFIPPLWELSSALDNLSVQRLDRKASRLKEAFETYGDPEQAFYEALAEALGYIKNRRPMMELAKVVPFSEARAVGDALELSLLFLEAASEIRGWEIWGTRPPNFPLPRIRGLAVLVERFSRTGFSEQILNALADPKGLPSLFYVKGLVGPGRARVIAVNVAVPFALALKPNLREEATRAWRLLPPEPENRILRRVREKVLSQIKGGLELLRKSHIRQGMIELYQRYCFLPLCETCPLNSAR